MISPENHSQTTRGWSQEQRSEEGPFLTLISVKPRRKVCFLSGHWESLCCRGRVFHLPGMGGAANLFTYQEDGLNKHQLWGQWLRGEGMHILCVQALPPVICDCHNVTNGATFTPCAQPSPLSPGLLETQVLGICPARNSWSLSSSEVLQLWQFGAGIKPVDLVFSVWCWRGLFFRGIVTTE